MPLPKPTAHTEEDYWNLPDDQRAELIDGELYAMTPPGRTHQEIVAGLVQHLRNHVDDKGGTCKVYPAPFAVNLDGNDKTWVEPDVLVVCDPSKLSERGCEGAPDLVVEVVSPSSLNRDYFVKSARYQRAGVREYWIVDPACRQVVVYRYETPEHVLHAATFDEEVPVGIFPGLAIRVADFV